MVDQQTIFKCLRQTTRLLAKTQLLLSIFIHAQTSIRTLTDQEGKRLQLVLEDAMKEEKERNQVRGS